jgi:ribonucleoside-diphosphate reductase alpha chain
MRRETWGEAINRYCADMFTRAARAQRKPLDRRLQQRLHDALLNGDIQPSMRTLATAGKALASCELANYNCTYVGVSEIDAIGDIAHILMSGSGVGFSVEQHFIGQLPSLEPANGESVTLTVDDSRAGWSRHIKDALRELYSGRDVVTDISQLREEGARLNTFGGYASGGMVLFDAFEKIKDIFTEARATKQYKLSAVQVADIVLLLASCIVSGGVRRSATIILFDRDDEGMLKYKDFNSGVVMWSQDETTGKWVPGKHAHRALANVSAVCDSWKDYADFKQVWDQMIVSGAGEPGLVNRAAMYRANMRIGRDILDENGELIRFGLNPCGEIILQPYQACNLTTLNIRASDTEKTLLEKVELATILGTIQALITSFEHVDKRWNSTVERERLLGVCLTGIFDNEMTSTPGSELETLLQKLRAHARHTNSLYADAFRIPRSAAITAIKPAGNSSQLYDTASGIHPRFSEHYIRRIRQSKGDPISRFLKDAGVHTALSSQNESDVVFSFVRKAPANTRTAEQVTALEQARLWLVYAKNYTEHTVSCSIYYRANEAEELARFIYDNYEYFIGVSFIPYTDHVYPQAPYEKITAERYSELLSEQVMSIDWTRLKDYETTDTTNVSHEMACTAGGCETI